MNGVSALGNYHGMPATTVVRLSTDRPAAASNRRSAGAETILAAVSHPPRGSDPRPLAALLPQVLAQYGLTGHPATGHEINAVA